MRELVRRVWDVINKRRVEADLAEEMEFHRSRRAAVGRLLTQYLVRTAPTDPVALGLVSVLLIVVATAASVWPARRAARVDPVVALRYE